MVWEKFLTYPQSVRIRHPLTAEVLDTLEELNPPQEAPDRYFGFSEWLRQNVELGLIKRTEFYIMQSNLAPLM